MLRQEPYPGLSLCSRQAGEPQSRVACLLGHGVTFPSVRTVGGEPTHPAPSRPSGRGVPVAGQGVVTVGRGGVGMPAPMKKEGCGGWL